MKQIVLFSFTISFLAHGMQFPTLSAEDHVQKARQVLDSTLALNKGLPNIKDYCNDRMADWKKFKNNNLDTEETRKVLSSDHMRKHSENKGQSIDAEPEARFCFAFAQATEELVLKRASIISRPTITKLADAELSKRELDILFFQEARNLAQMITIATTKHEAPITFTIKDMFGS